MRKIIQIALKNLLFLVINIMKGIVFTALLEFLESSFGYKTVNDLVTFSNDSENGVYIGTGNYEDENLYNLLSTLSKITKKSSEELQLAFGKQLFGKLALRHPKLVDKFKSVFDLLCGLDDIIHIEVVKLYPNATPPRFIVKERNIENLTILYQSSRKLAPLAEGLIYGCGEYFQENLLVKRSLHTETSCLFNIKKAGI